MRSQRDVERGSAGIPDCSESIHGCRRAAKKQSDAVGERLRDLRGMERLTSFPAGPSSGVPVNKHFYFSPNLLTEIDENPITGMVSRTLLNNEDTKIILFGFAP